MDPNPQPLQNCKFFYRQYWHHRSSKDPSLVNLHAINPQPGRRQEIRHLLYIYVIKFKEIVKNFNEYEQIYTDGSKHGEWIGAAALFPNGAQKYQITRQILNLHCRTLCTSFSTGTHWRLYQKQFIIFSDFSAMQALKKIISITLWLEKSFPGSLI